MNFSNQKNNAREAVNVNTRGINFMNSEGFMPSTLQFGFWNEMISIRMHPALEKSQQTESKKFNYEEVVSTALTLEKATTLLNKIENDILPKYSEGKDKFNGVPVGGNSLIGVGIKALDDENSVAYLAIFKELDEGTKKPEVAMYYEFKSGYTVDDYDPETGKFDVTQNIPGELMLFAHSLRAAIAALTNANAHATRAVDRWFRDRLMNTLNEVAGKVGVQVNTGKSWGNGGGGNYRSKDVFGSSNSNSNNTSSDLSAGTDASIEKLENINSIEQFMM
jgi:hypothetical protein